MTNVIATPGAPPHTGDRSPHSARPDPEPDTARRQSADAQDDHADVPQGATVIPERKVEAVKAVEQPSLQATVPVHRQRDLTVYWIDIDPGLHRICELDTDDGAGAPHWLHARSSTRRMPPSSSAAAMGASGSAAPRRATAVSTSTVVLPPR